MCGLVLFLSFVAYIGRYLDNETIDDEWRRRRVERAERALASSLATVSPLIKMMSEHRMHKTNNYIKYVVPNRVEVICSVYKYSNIIHYIIICLTVLMNSAVNEFFGVFVMSARVPRDDNC